MTNEQVIADVVALSPALVAIVALLLNYRGFTSLERRMERLEDDMKLFNKSIITVEADVAAIKDRLRMA